jgi:hypothetical protein
MTAATSRALRRIVQRPRQDSTPPESPIVGGRSATSDAAPRSGVDGHAMPDAVRPVATPEGALAACPMGIAENGRV